MSGQRDGWRKDVDDYCEGQRECVRERKSKRKRSY